MKEIPQAEEEIDLGRILFVMLAKSWIILFVSVLGAAIALVGTYWMVTPQYSSTVTLYVNDGKASENLEDSFSVIVKMRETLLDVIKYTQTDRNHNELREMVEVACVNDTDFYELTVTCGDPYEAERLANAIGEMLPEKITEIMSDITVAVVDRAVIAAGPSSPNYANNGLLGSVIGMALSMIVIFLQELFPSKEKIRTNERCS